MSGQSEGEHVGKGVLMGEQGKVPNGSPGLSVAGVWLGEQVAVGQVLGAAGAAGHPEHDLAGRGECLRP